MITTSITTQPRNAACRMQALSTVAPQAGFLPGSESAYATAGNPGFGAAINNIMGVSRVRDAKQAAPPRGRLC
jgi:hypothetical protein